MKKISEKSVRRAIETFNRFKQYSPEDCDIHHAYITAIPVMEQWLERHKEVKRKIKRINMNSNKCKKFLKTLVLIFACSFMVGCVVKGEEVQTENKNVKVEKLFTVDNITVYRFMDSGDVRYFTNRGTMFNEHNEYNPATKTTRERQDWIN